MRVELEPDGDIKILTEDDLWYANITMGRFESGLHSKLYLSFPLKVAKELQEKLNELLKEDN